MKARKKYQILIVSIVPLLLMVYKLSISPTIDQYIKYQLVASKHKIEKLNRSKNISRKAEEKKARLKLQKFISDTTDISGVLLNSLTEFCSENKLQFKEYTPYSSRVNSKLEILTSMIVVEGEFIKCLQLVYAMEKKWTVGKVRSVNYKTKLDPVKNQISLQCTIYIQNIIG